MSEPTAAQSSATISWERAEQAKYPDRPRAPTSVPPRRRQYWRRIATLIAVPVFTVLAYAASPASFMTAHAQNPIGISGRCDVAVYHDAFFQHQSQSYSVETAEWVLKAHVITDVQPPDDASSILISCKFQSFSAQHVEKALGVTLASSPNMGGERIFQSSPLSPWTLTGDGLVSSETTLQLNNLAELGWNDLVESIELDLV